MEEGENCPECKKGVMILGEVENCSCHIDPPCSACVDNLLICNACDFEEEKWKIGDKVNYLGTRTRESPQVNCFIQQIELKGKHFNTDMAVLDKVKCWVSFHELKLVTEAYIIVRHKETGRAFSMTRQYGVLSSDLGIIDVPTKFVEDFEGWLGSHYWQRPDWVNKLGENISNQFHAYWLS